MSEFVCRLCGRRTRYKLYCEKCVKSQRLRSSLNHVEPKTANMVIVDFRAKNQMDILKAARLANVDKESWRSAEIDNRKGLSREVMSKIAYLIGYPVESLFNGYIEIGLGRSKKRIGIGSSRNSRNLLPGENQELLSKEAKIAKDQGYNSYGKWRAGIWED